ncbi:hypothetical protein GGX14DRAFT_696406 [Mycena pura]|uniref:Uncharacterized protein n=1 Tax=Mycena pura TaxID=153505 RepID=A0AAD6YGI6_9AGAR|nr:hypothetical protein GGX14DRAFT_696406 [Mycena pura]
MLRLARCASRRPQSPPLAAHLVILFFMCRSISISDGIYLMIKARRLNNPSSFALNGIIVLGTDPYIALNSGSRVTIVASAANLSQQVHEDRAEVDGRLDIPSAHAPALAHETAGHNTRGTLDVGMLTTLQISYNRAASAIAELQDLVYDALAQRQVAEVQVHELESSLTIPFLAPVGSAGASTYADALAPIPPSSSSQTSANAAPAATTPDDTFDWVPELGDIG